MKDKLRFVGLDVHADTIVIAVAEEGRAAAQVLATIPNDINRLRARLKAIAAGGPVSVCYEAGPTGYALYRQLHSAGVDCQVIAPSLIPKKSGQATKTDRRDAAALAHFLRSGDLTPVWVPSEESEALRDLARARSAAKRAEIAARQQLSKFLLRHGHRWNQGSNWTVAHLAWIRSRSFEQQAQKLVLADDLQAVEDATARVDRLEKHIRQVAPQVQSLWPLIRALQAFRGIALITAVGLASELGDLKRFKTPRQLMAFLGLVPSEQSSGLSQRRGSITKSGNHQARWLLVEAAQHASQLPVTSRLLRERRQGLAPGVVRIAKKAMDRLFQRFVDLNRKGKSRNKIVVAVARELAGFIWAVGQEEKLLAE